MFTTKGTPNKQNFSDFEKYPILRQWSNIFPKWTESHDSLKFMDPSDKR